MQDRIIFFGISICIDALFVLTISLGVSLDKHKADIAYLCNSYPSVELDRVCIKRTP